LLGVSYLDAKKGIATKTLKFKYLLFLIHQPIFQFLENNPNVRSFALLMVISCRCFGAWMLFIFLNIVLMLAFNNTKERQ